MKKILFLIAIAVVGISPVLYFRYGLFKPKITLEQAIFDLKTEAIAHKAINWYLDDDGSTPPMYCALAYLPDGDYYVSCEFDPIEAAENCAKSLAENKPYSHKRKVIAEGEQK